MISTKEVIKDEAPEGFIKANLYIDKKEEKHVIKCSSVSEDNGTFGGQVAHSESKDWEEGDYKKSLKMSDYKRFIGVVKYTQRY